MNSNRSYQPILVTGSHRSGTTWVGKMLCAGGQAAYISEPLNRWHRPGILSAPVRDWYTYICAENEAAYLPALRQTLALRYHLWAEIQSLRSRKDLLRMGRDFGTFARGRLMRQRPLLKDPFALFSAPWFAERLGCRVVIVVRHPLALASSLKRLNWPFDFGHLLGQPLLMRDWLEPYRREMEALLGKPDDIIGQSSLLWRILYETADWLRRRDPSFVIVRHEDLSLAPCEGFRDLFRALDLSFTPAVEQAIQQSSAGENPAEVSHQHIYATHLNSRANLENWKRRLAPEEILRIRCETEVAADLFYPDWEWNL